MKYERTWLAHYGVEGQKWGVRRYQNRDGSYTAEGKRRLYAFRAQNGSFKKAENSVRNSLSNNPKPIKKDPIDMQIVKRRGGLNDSEARRCSDLAIMMYDKASLAEPGITKDVISAVTDTGGNMFGLGFRLKTPTSLAAKIGADAKSDDISFEKSAKSINDAIRYTSVSDDVDFVENYRNVKYDLEQKGYTEIRCKNYFDKYRKRESLHKSVQSAFADPHGNTFEIQFQTVSSQAAKELKLPLYNKRRQSGLSERQKRDIDKQMIALAEHVSDPEDVFKILSHK